MLSRVLIQLLQSDRPTNQPENTSIYIAPPRAAAASGGPAKARREKVGSSCWAPRGWGCDILLDVDLSLSPSSSSSCPESPSPTRTLLLGPTRMSLNGAYTNCQGVARWETSGYISRLCAWISLTRSSNVQPASYNPREQSLSIWRKGWERDAGESSRIDSAAHVCTTITDNVETWLRLWEDWGWGYRTLCHHRSWMQCIVGKCGT